MSKSPLGRVVRIREDRKGSNRVPSFLDSDDPTDLAIGFTELSRKREDFYGLPRMSGLYDMCIREYILGHRLRRKKVQYIDASLSIVFDIGHAIHSIVQNSDRYFKGMKMGYWKCLSCEHDTSVVNLRPAVCPICHKDRMEYKEVDLKIPGLTAHPDLFLKLPQTEKARVAEIKTMKKDQFLGLLAPLPENVYQMTGYVYMANKTGIIDVDTETGYLVYVSKEHPGTKTFPIKIFKVKPEPVYTKDIEEKVFQYLNYYDPETRTVKGLPLPIDACKNTHWNGYRSKSCPVLKECRAYAEKNEK